MPKQKETKKEYGRHQYSDDGSPDCMLGCGCWIRTPHSGGPAGLDPFGKCPRNPVNGMFLSENADHVYDRDYGYILNERIQELAARLKEAEEKLKQAAPSKVIKELEAVKKQLAEKNQLLAEVRGAVKIKDLIGVGKR
jgi:hypothetical protein